MKLIFKFAVLMIIPIAGLMFTFYEAQRALNQLARDHVKQQANLLMDAAIAARSYTTNHIKDLLLKKPELSLKSATPREFLRETVPAYAAKQLLKNMFSGENQKEYEAYNYKEVAVHPTLKEDEASPEELEWIKEFRNHENKKTKDGSPRSMPDVYFYARPMKATKDCKDCHSTKEQAKSPKVIEAYGDMFAAYGEENVGGFNWKEGEVVAAQVVYVPRTVPEAIASEAIGNILIAIVIAGILTIVSLWGALVILVIRPVARLSAMAEQISRGRLSATELPVRGNDEMAQLTAAFNRMNLSLYKAVKRLKHD